MHLRACPGVRLPRVRAEVERVHGRVASRQRAHRQARGVSRAQKLRNAVTPLMREDGYGEGYKYGTIPKAPSSPARRTCPRSCKEPCSTSRRRAAKRRVRRSDCARSVLLPTSDPLAHPLEGLTSYFDKIRSKSCPRSWSTMRSSLARWGIRCAWRSSALRCKRALRGPRQERSRRTSICRRRTPTQVFEMFEESLYRATALDRFLAIRTGFVAAFCHEKRSPAVIKPWEQRKVEWRWRLRCSLGDGRPGRTVAH